MLPRRNRLPSGRTLDSELDISCRLGCLVANYRFRLISTNAAFRDIVISLAATYGLYFFSSFLHFEPWHMFTSFIRKSIPCSLYFIF
jgi:hypothetical protein